MILPMDTFTPPPPPFPAEEKIPPSSRAATWSLVCSLVGLACPFLFAAVPGIVLGHVGLHAIHKSNGRLRGRFRAVTGLCLGYLVLFLHVFLLVNFFRGSDSLVHRWRSPPNTAVVLAFSDSTAPAGDVHAVLRNRLRAANVPHRFAEFGTDRVEIHFNAQRDRSPEWVVDLLLRPANLEFRLVHEDNDRLVSDLFAREIAPPGFQIVENSGIKFYGRNFSYDLPENWAELIAQTGRVSPLYELMLEKTVLEGPSGWVYRPYFVGIPVLLEGSAITRARPEPDMYGRFQVAIRFTPEGTRQFAELTRDYSPGGPKNPSSVGRKLAIVMDDVLYSAPTMNQPILGGQAVITGAFSLEEAHILANALNAGTLPVDLKIQEIREL